MGGSQRQFLAMVLTMAAIVPGWAAVAPPFQNSKLGYVRVGADGVSLPPGHKRAFIQPRTRLPIVMDDKDALTLAAVKDGDTLLCSVPKTPANMVLVKVPPKRGSAVFSGPLEAETIPFPLLKGEELPILERLPDGFRVNVSRNGHILPLIVPAQLKGTSFAASSEFDAFAERQRRRGLAELDGHWLPEAKAKALVDSRRSRAEAVKKRERLVLAQAESGMLVLKSRETLDGSLKGFDGHKLLFATSDGSRWIPLEDVVDSPLADALALGHLFKAEKKLAAAQDLKLDQQIAASLSLAEAATQELDAMPPSTVPAKQAAALRSQADSWTKNLRARLAAKRLAVCGDETLPSAEVAWHLSQGHIRFKHQYWLEKNQLCSHCHGNGELKCPGCAGKGKTSRLCDACGGEGKLVCPRCGGSGWRRCQQCNGTGAIPKTCPRCQGTGQVKSRTPTYYGDAPSTSFIGNGMVLNFGGGYSPVWKVYAWVTCPVCDGYGTIAATCPSCNGQGKVPCPKTVACSACSGKGVFWNACVQCGGAKQIICPNCAGRGFTGAPCASP